MKSSAENIPDPVQLCSNVSGRHACDFRDRGRVQIFEIQKHQFTIGGAQTMNQPEEMIKCHLLIGDVLVVCVVRLRIKLFERHQVLELGLTLPDDVRQRCIMSDAIGPGSQRATPLEIFQTAPQREMDFLKQIPPLFRICFVCHR